MSRILRTYVIREVALPSLLTLMTIVFIMLMGQVYQLITLLMQPSVSALQVVEALLGLIPQILVLAIPMAVLIGVLIGVGRMTLDREMLAARASGINLFSIYIPTILAGLLLSLIIMGLSYSIIPRMMLSSLNKLSQMKLALVTSLNPGEFHGPKDLAQDESRDFEVYFRERDANDSSIMKGIMIKLEDSVGTAKGAGPASSAANQTSATLGDIVSSATLARAAAVLPAGAAPAGKNKNSKKAAADALTTPTARRNQLTFITAESGVIGLTIGDSTATVASARQRADAYQAQLVFNLKNGAFHQLSPDPSNRQYVSATFPSCQYSLPGNTEIKKVYKTKSVSELLQDIRKNKPSSRDSKSDAEAKKKVVGSAKRELTQRCAISLASFVFFLIGIPLAIWVRPSGKSWGILLAIGLMLIYYVIMSAGLVLVEREKSFGYLLAFSPNLLYLFLGAGLWRHTVRS